MSASLSDDVFFNVKDPSDPRAHRLEPGDLHPGRVAWKLKADGGTEEHIFTSKTKPAQFIQAETYRQMLADQKHRNRQLYSQGSLELQRKIKEIRRRRRSPVMDLPAAREPAIVVCGGWDV